MPRPGPRPYECVRRAWHSDRHDPMRGSLIQEIFRIANEIHGSATKKNKEWQEKLPLVVLKAEEIIYSKANSEAEYMDLKTLLDRANDAINTIIRRDEESETGQLLPPCIEAALNLGCIPRRASRSQRNNSPRCYLSSTTHEVTTSTVGSKVADNMVLKGVQHAVPHQSSNPAPSSPQLARYQSSLLNAPTVNATCLRSGSGYPIEGKPMYHSCSSLSIESFSQKDRYLPKKMHQALDLRQMQPMYFKANNMETRFTVQFPQILNLDAVYAVPPRVPPFLVAEPGFFPNLCQCQWGDLQDAPTQNSRALNFGIISEKSTNMECDLALRLAPLSIPCVSTEHAQIVEDGGSHSSFDGSRFCDHSFSKIMTSQFG